MSSRKTCCPTSIVVATTDLSQNSFNFDLQTSHQVYPTQNFEPDPFLTSRRSRNDQNWPKILFSIKADFRGGQPLPVCSGLITTMAMAVAVIRPGYSYRGQPPRKSFFFMKNAGLGLFWSFLDLLDLKNGSGSKFRVEWWYQEVWKSKLKLFHDKSLKRY